MKSSIIHVRRSGEGLLVACSDDQSRQLRSRKSTPLPRQHIPMNHVRQAKHLADLYDCLDDNEQGDLSISFRWLSAWMAFLDDDDDTHDDTLPAELSVALQASDFLSDQDTVEAVIKCMALRYLSETALTVCATEESKDKPTTPMAYILPDLPPNLAALVLQACVHVLLPTIVHQSNRPGLAFTPSDSIDGSQCEFVVWTTAVWEHSAVVTPTYRALGALLCRLPPRMRPLALTSCLPGIEHSQALQLNGLDVTTAHDLIAAAAAPVAQLTSLSLKNYHAPHAHEPKEAARPRSRKSAKSQPAKCTKRKRASPPQPAAPPPSLPNPIAALAAHPSLLSLEISNFLPDSDPTSSPRRDVLAVLPQLPQLTRLDLSASCMANEIRGRQWIHMDPWKTLGSMSSLAVLNVAEIGLRADCGEGPEGAFFDSFVSALACLTGLHELNLQGNNIYKRWKHLAPILARLPLQALDVQHIGYDSWENFGGAEDEGLNDTDGITMYTQEGKEAVCEPSTRLQETVECLRFGPLPAWADLSGIDEVCPRPQDCARLRELQLNCDGAEELDLLAGCEMPFQLEKFTCSISDLGDASAPQALCTFLTKQSRLQHLDVTFFHNPDAVPANVHSSVTDSIMAVAKLAALRSLRLSLAEVFVFEDLHPVVSCLTDLTSLWLANLCQSYKPDAFGALRSLVALEELSLHHVIGWVQERCVPSGHKEHSALAMALSSLTLLTHLKLSDLGIDQRFTDVYSTSLRALSNLRELRLPEALLCSLGDVLAPDMPWLRSLKVLDLRDTFYELFHKDRRRFGGVAGSTPVLLEMLPQMTSLVHLDLSCDSIKEGDGFLEALKQVVVALPNRDAVVYW